jgi:hypothetical protein
MDTMTTEPKRKRQERSPELKAQILIECERPGALVAQVALAHGVNAKGVARASRESRVGAAPRRLGLVQPFTWSISARQFPFAAWAAVRISTAPSGSCRWLFGDSAAVELPSPWAFA